ncbi:MAG: acetolactate synthase small subunit [Chloroflexi bacterium]|nr:MAG: acetolactate synthase small subunit [Chloroflexota bacterium]
MTKITAPAERSGHSDVSRDVMQAYTLVVLVEDRLGAVDRVFSLFRRRRANMQTLVLGRCELPDVIRITVAVNDSEVGIDHLVEQLRKIIDVRKVAHFMAQQAITRELALIKVSRIEEHTRAIIELASLFGATVVDLTASTVTLEVSGSSEKIDKLVGQVQRYGIREIVRTGSVAMAYDAEDK